MKKRGSVKKRALPRFFSLVFTKPLLTIPYYNMGLVYQDKGEYDKALEYYETALDIYEKLLGKKHPNTSIIYNNIATVYQLKGEQDKAFEYSEKTSGENHQTELPRTKAISSVDQGTQKPLTNYDPSSSNQDTLEFFEIIGLYGDLNYKIPFENEKCVLLGLNGTGKTTVLRLLYYFLKTDTYKLAQFDFEQLSIKLANGSIFSLSKKQLDLYIDNYNKRTGEISFESRKIKENKSLLESLTEVSNTIESIKIYIEKFNLLFFPAYRHMEKIMFNMNDFPVRPSRPLNHFNRYNEYEEEEFDSVITIGMESIHSNIKEAMAFNDRLVNEITHKACMSIVGNFISGKYDNLAPDKRRIIRQTPNTSIRKVLSELQSYIEFNLDDTIETITKHKNRLKKTVSARHLQNSNEILNALADLLEMNTQIKEANEKVDRFFEIVNNYLVGKNIDKKQVNKDTSNIIKLDKNNKFISLDELSSGEQQIISILTRLYLIETEKPIMIIIDEPEMSLSAPWQDTFLNDIMGGNCKVFLGATHSPDMLVSIDEKYRCSIDQCLYDTDDTEDVE